MSFSPEHGFDYSTLNQKTATVVRACTREIQSRMVKTVEQMIAIGSQLQIAKQELQHGQFESWVLQELNLHPRQARRLILVAKQFKSDIMSDLEIAPTALYHLAEPQTPDKARKEAINRAGSGEKITLGLAKEIILRHKGKTGESDSHPTTSKHTDDVIQTQNTAESIHSEISSCENDENPEYVDIDAITLPEDAVDTDQNLEPQKSFSVGDRIRIIRKEQGPDKWSGKIAKIWEVTEEGSLRVNVEGHKGVRFTLHPDWVERLEETNVIEPNDIQAVPYSAPLVTEQQVQVSIPREIEGKTINFDGITHVDIVYKRQGKTETIRIPVDKITFS